MCFSQSVSASLSDRFSERFVRMIRVVLSDSLTESVVCESDAVCVVLTQCRRCNVKCGSVVMCSGLRRQTFSRSEI